MLLSSPRPLATKATSMSGMSVVVTAYHWAYFTCFEQHTLPMFADLDYLVLPSTTHQDLIDQLSQLSTIVP